MLSPIRTGLDIYVHRSGRRFWIWSRVKAYVLPNIYWYIFIIPYRFAELYGVMRLHILLILARARQSRGNRIFKFSFNHEPASRKWAYSSARSRRRHLGRSHDWMLRIHIVIKCFLGAPEAIVAH